MRKWLAGVIAAIALAVALFWHHHAARDAAHTTTTSPGSAANKADHVRRLAPEERRRVGEQIAQAIAHASPTGSQPSTATTATATSATGSAPALPDAPTIPLEQVGTPLHDALTAAIPLLADCFKQHGATAAAQMTMWSDPDTGTVIDTKALHDGSGQPLDPAVESCMRDAIDSLELPPLGQPGKLDLEYSFKF